ncbi:hypothetical protein [Clostridium sp. C8-1-8]|uniref:alpha/beta hydrolase family protein n=1 Tax=Clostridium sp. C8-1-8 TaxID=2698831 RepID=UPI0013691AB6|nr:hypothetical protein [Clostridium sp. C8-1-8]
MKTLINSIKKKHENAINSMNNYFQGTLVIPKITLTLLILAIALSLPFGSIKGKTSLVYAFVIFVLALLVILVLSLIFRFTRLVLSSITRALLPIIFVTFIILMFYLNYVLYASPLLSIVISIIAILVETTLGLSIGVLVKKRFKDLISWILLIATFSLNIGLVYYLRSPGNDDNSLNKYISSIKTKNLELNADDPSKNGTYSVKTLYYGSGKDKNRNEYGKDVNIKTNSVDLSPFLENYKGLTSSLRTLYWGFDDKSMPVNGRVWYPEGNGKFPLVLMVHGNHMMEEYSDEGYSYLGNLLASRGYIAVSIDENFLNMGMFMDLGKESDGRAYLMLKHLDAWSSFNSDKSNPFYEKIDMENIALMGHSRGGDAVTTAALFNTLTKYPDNSDISFKFNYKIKSVIAIAPSYGQYRPADKLTKIKNVNYLLLQGANDDDVSSFSGRWQYNNVSFDKDTDYFKSLLYIYKANHGQFNTVWGDTDIPGTIGGWLLDRKPLLKASEQQEVAKVYISAFLDTTLKNNQSYKPMFENYQYASKWLPKSAYINDYQDSKFETISNFEEDQDLTTGTLKGVTLSGTNLSFAEKNQGFKRPNNAFQDNSVLSINLRKSDSSYKIDLSEDALKALQLKTDSKLSLSVASNDEASYKKGSFDAKYFTIKATDKNGNSASVKLEDYNILHPSIGLKMSKLFFFTQGRFGGDFEPVLQVFNIPLKDFKAANSNFNTDTLKSIEFVFDKDKQGNLMIDDIGIE